MRVASGDLERAAGELSVSRLQELMIEAQRRCYGDALDEGELDPWFWASNNSIMVCLSDARPQPIDWATSRIWSGWLSTRTKNATSISARILSRQINSTRGPERPDSGAIRR